MLENKGKSEKEELDEFAQALLDKKTEMSLYKDLPKDDTKETLNGNDLKQAEETMSSALDMLRKERGQMTIEEEEIEYQKRKENPEIDGILDDILEDEDFTTSSLHNDDFLSNNLKNVHNALESDGTQKKKRKKEKNTQKYNSEQEPKQEKLESVKENKKKKKKVKWIVAVIAVILCLMGAYAYKIYVYDPQNVASEAQIASYEKLQKYADEYGDDMLLEAEKFELLDMRKDYTSLLDKQKTEINAYFKEQTGKTYKALYKELKALKEEQEDEANADYQTLVSYFTDWANKSDDDKMNILNLKTNYDNLSSSLQKKINTLSREQASKSFNSLYKEYEQKKSEQEAQAQEEEKNSQKEYYQSLLDQASEELETYQAYASVLQEELASAQANGEDTSEIESQISVNNQLIQQYQNNISSYQSTINSLS